MPQLVSDFGRKLQLISQYKGEPVECSLSPADEPEAMMKMISSQKSLANEQKRSAGKRVMMRKLGDTVFAWLTIHRASGGETC